MDNRRLRLLAVFLPLLFGVALALLRITMFGFPLNWVAEILTLAIIFVAATLFSNWIFDFVESREREIRRRTEQLASLNEASLLLTRELELGTVLQKVVDLARELVDAQYGALGVLDEKGGRIDQFVTSGMSVDNRRAIGTPPRGRGIIGALIHEGRPIRIDDIEKDVRSVGFPPNHPKMHGFLGVPIRYKGRILGNLYLTNKKSYANSIDVESIGFSRVDQQIVEMFASQAAIAIENAQLYRKVQQLAILQERERFGMDLHDGVIQSIYGIGLVLEDTQLLIESEPEVVKNRIQRTIIGLNELIHDIRNYILDLRPERFKGRNLQSGLEELVREFRANTLLEVDLHTDSLDPRRLTAEQTVEILHIAQEALINIRKHARASNVGIDLIILDHDLLLTIQDDGIGINPDLIHVGNGLRNMRERANVLEGDIAVIPGEVSGTKVVLRVPVEPIAETAYT